MIFLDYARQTRLRVFGIAHVTDVHRESPHASPLAMPGYRARGERELRIDVTAYDWNCPQRITPRFSAAEIARMHRDEAANDQRPRNGNQGPSCSARDRHETVNRDPTTAAGMSGTTVDYNTIR